MRSIQRLLGALKQDSALCAKQPFKHLFQSLPSVPPVVDWAELGWRNILERLHSLDSFRNQQKTSASIVNNSCPKISTVLWPRLQLLTFCCWVVLPVAQAGSGAKEHQCLKRRVRFQDPLPPALEQFSWFLTLNEEPEPLLPPTSAVKPRSGGERNRLTKQALHKGFHETFLCFRNSLFCRKVHFSGYLSRLTMGDGLNPFGFLSWKQKLFLPLPYYGWGGKKPQNPCIKTMRIILHNTKVLNLRWHWLSTLKSLQSSVKGSM